MKTLAQQSSYIAKRIFVFIILAILFYIPGQFILNTTIFSEKTAYIFRNCIVMAPFIIMTFIIIISRIIKKLKRR